jgi:hypothetical protein
MASPASQPTAGLHQSTPPPACVLVTSAAGPPAFVSHSHPPAHRPASVTRTRRPAGLHQFPAHFLISSVPHTLAPPRARRANLAVFSGTRPWAVGSGRPTPYPGGVPGGGAGARGSLMGKRQSPRASGVPRPGPRGVSEPGWRPGCVKRARQRRVRSSLARGPLGGPPGRCGSGHVNVQGGLAALASPPCGASARRAGQDSAPGKPYACAAGISTRSAAGARQGARHGPRRRRLGRPTTASGPLWPFGGGSDGPFVRLRRQRCGA